MRPYFFLLIILSAITLLAGGPGRRGNSRADYEAAAWRPMPAATVVPNKKLTAEEAKIEQRDLDQAGIKVEEPEVFDDAMLQQMLSDLEAKLASLQAIDQSALRSGAISGASQQISSFGLSVQGPSLPGVTTVDKGATGSVAETQKLNGSGQTTETTIVTTNGLESGDATTTRTQTNPPAVTALAPSTTLPSSPTTAASRNLNEQMQVSAQIQMLRLLLRGSLSSQFIRPNAGTGSQMTKLKTTLGFPITVNPDKRYRNAVAIVEVEVEKEADLGGATFTCQNTGDGGRLACTDGKISFHCKKLADSKDIAPYGCATASNEFLCSTDSSDQITCRNGTGGEGPMITALLPQEKTYNVAAITDKSFSVGGGMVTQVLGVSGSWLSGRKTYYLTQDQDTVALGFRPEGPPNKKVGFLWQFRPVLGREFAQTERKYAFVQLAFPAPLDAQEGDIGTIHVRTYWREYNYKKNVVGGIIPNSLKDALPGWKIPNYAENAAPIAFNNNSLEDLPGGKMRVSVMGRFSPGTSIRIGDTVPAIKADYYFIRFIASINDLATKKVYLVAPDGRESQLVIDHWDTPTNRKSPPTILGSPIVETLDEINSTVTVELASPTYFNERPSLIVVAGGQVFRPKRVSGTNKFTVIVPTSILVENQKLALTSYFARDGWNTSIPLPNYGSTSRTERLAVMEKGKDFYRFLLYGNRLSGIRLVTPTQGAALETLVASEDNAIQILRITADSIAANKYIFLQRPNEHPFPIIIPALDFKDKIPTPKMLERILTNSEEAVVQDVAFEEVKTITFHGQPLTFVKDDDIPGIRLTGLRASGITGGTASIQPLLFTFKSGAKVTVNLEVVGSKVENIPK